MLSHRQPPVLPVTINSETKLSPLAALKVVILTICGAASGDNFITITIFSFRWNWYQQLSIFNGGFFLCFYDFPRVTPTYRVTSKYDERSYQAPSLNTWPIITCDMNRWCAVVDWFLANSSFDMFKLRDFEERGWLNRFVRNETGNKMVDCIAYLGEWYSRLTTMHE